MFVVDITYKVSLDKIDAYLENHIAFLNNQYNLGNFEVSGKKVPRTGGVILSNITNKSKLIEILEEDPFKKLDLAEYHIIEFIPSKTSKKFKSLLK